MRKQLAIIAGSIAVTLGGIGLLSAPAAANPRPEYCCQLPPFSHCVLASYNCSYDEANDRYDEDCTWVC